MNSPHQSDGHFTQSLWSRNTHRFEQICAHPFNRELSNGTLSLERYRHYIVQDTLYLEHFAGALVLAASKAVSSTDGDRRCRLLLAHGQGVLDIEGGHHDRILAKLGLGSRAEILANYTPSVACHHYICFLTSIASQESLPVMMAAMLACYWLYREIGRWMAAEWHKSGMANSDHPYQDWIELNTGEEYSEQVDQVLELTEELAREADEGTRRRMETMFDRAFQLEWMFWDSAYRMEQWHI